MSSYHGTHLLAFDAQMPRLWDVNYNPINKLRQLAVRRSVVEGMIKPSMRELHIRVPFNPTLNENQLEILTDAILELGFKYKDCVISQYGVYQQIWIFVRSD